MDDIQRMCAHITHVAIRFQGQVWSLLAPSRHHDVIRMIVEQTGVACVDSHGDDQGFLDADGRYLTRRQALISARANNQMKADRPTWHGELYSENVW